MCFIANALEQAQSTRIERQLQGQRPVGAINLFLFLRQSDNRKVMLSQSLQLAACGGELAFSTIDNDEIGQTNVRLRIADCGLRTGQAFRNFECILLRIFRGVHARFRKR